MTLIRYECRSCGANSPGGPVAQCHRCLERFENGEIDELGREIVPVTLERLSPTKWKATWPRHPESIAHGLMGTELERQPIKILREVTMPNKRFLVELSTHPVAVAEEQKALEASSRP